MWYVMHVATGREEILRRGMATAMPEHCVEECRILRCEIMKRYKGTWHRQEKLLVPGYLFIRTDQVEQLQYELRRFPEMTKLLEQDGKIIPLLKEEENLFFTLYGKGEYIGMSYGVQVGDRVMVQEGPLKGYEYLIQRIDRHKRRAYIKIELLGTMKELELGLEIVEKQV